MTRGGVLARTAGASLAPERTRVVYVPDMFRALLGAALVLVSACTGHDVPRAPRPAAPTPPEVEVEGAPEAGSAPAAEPTHDPNSPASPVDPGPFVSSTPELARFHAALNGLERKTRREHVRVLWLGDSHGQADFWSGKLRKLLADRFGGAGPGFVHLGYKNYRHDGLKIDVKGRWRMRPKKPVSTKRQGDGVYGLGGLMMSGYADGPRVEIAFSEVVPGETLHYDLCYRFVEAGDALATSVDGKAEVTRSEKDEGRGQVVHLELTASTEEPFVVRPIGRTDLCGVVVEADPKQQPGVVVDTLAINGARYGTALAWDAQAWQAEVARRKPSLVVFEYGTNEAGDVSPPYNKVGKQVGELLGRVREVAPEADCVVVSPTDRGDAEEEVATMRQSIMTAAKAARCYWFDAWKILGGQGAFAKLAAEPEPKVQKDEVHLTIKGYRELAQTMYEELMAGYGR